MKEHYVTVTQNYVGQFHWKIEGYVWQTTDEKRVCHSPRRKKLCFRQSITFAKVKNKYKWNSSTKTTEPNERQTGKQVFETYRGC